MSELTKGKKIAKIYAEIADKTISFGCKVEVRLEYKSDGTWAATVQSDYGLNTTHKEYITVISGGNGKSIVAKDKIKKIIGHPVMLGDVLDRVESKLEDNYFVNFYIEDLIIDICNKRKHKRKPIEEQDENCISFVYSLIKDQG